MAIDNRPVVSTTGILNAQEGFVIHIWLSSLRYLASNKKLRNTFSQAYDTKNITGRLGNPIHTFACAEKDDHTN
jgi:hypothetical protein